MNYEEKRHRWSEILLSKFCQLQVVILVLALSLFGKAWAIDTGPVGPVVVKPGSYIVDLGQATQSYATGLKPYGLVYDLIVIRKVPVDWVISPGKLFGGTDFTLGAKTYSGSAFIIRAEYVTPAAITAINSFKALGVVVDGPTTAGATSVPVYNTLTSWPNSVLDSAKGSIAAAFYTNASIPATAYRFALPTALTPCDDFFALPHADPAWATHGLPLKNFVVNRGGYFWAGCHAVSVFENLVNPADATDRSNFLSTNGLVPFGSHADGSPPYSYKTSGGSEPPMQFLGNLDAASQNGSEQIYLPAKPGGWRATSSVLVWDASHADVPSKSLGEAAQLVYGRAFGLTTAGRAMYEGGHDIDTGNNAAAVAAERAYFDFLLLAGIDRRPEISATIPGTIASGATASVSASVTGGTPLYSYSWTSTCGGSFSSTTAANPTFTAPAVTANTNCIVRVEVKDACNRVNFLSSFIAITPPLVVPRIDITKRVSGTVTQISPGAFEVPYSLDIKNAGTVLAANIQVVDDLAAAFPGATITIKSGTMNLGALTAPTPTAFNGISQKTLLDGGDSLATGALASIKFTVVIDYGANPVPTTVQNNSATATNAATKGGAPLSTDISTNNIDNGVTQPSATDTPAPTPVSFVPQKLDVVKSAGTPIQTGAGIFEIPYLIKLKNTGAIPVTNVQIVDNLAATFNTGTPLPGITIKAASFTTTAQGGASALQCAGPTTTYNGTSAIALLKGDQILQVAQECDITFTAVVTYSGTIPSTAQNNIAYASSAPSPNAGGGVDPTTGAFTPPPNVLSTDSSTNGNSFTGTANGDTPAPTPVSFSAQRIDAVKSAGAPVQTALSTFEIPYTVIVKNTGTIPATNVQAVDGLSATYSAGSPIITIKAGSFIANATTSAAVCVAPGAAYNGTNNIALLSGSGNLAVGEQCTIKFTAIVAYPSVNDIPGTAQNNTVFATTNTGANTGGTVNPATGSFTPSSGTVAQDASTSGAVAPATANGDAPTPNPVILVPQKLDVVKSVGNVLQTGSTSFEVSYNIKLKNTGTVATPNVQGVDSLAASFSSGAPTVSVKPASFAITPAGGAVATQCAGPVSPFNGSTNISLLTGDQTLQPGQECDILFTALVNYSSVAAIPTTAQNNSAHASASASGPNPGGTVNPSTGVFTPPATAAAIDSSSNSTATPALANGDTPSPSPVSFVQQKIDVVKQAGVPLQIGVSTFEIPYTVIVKNTGAIPATNVQAVDSLAFTYQSGSPAVSVKAGTFSANAPTSAASCLAPSAAFNGATNIALLSGNNNLAVGEQCTITFTVVVAYPSTAAIPSSAQNNSVFASTNTGPNSGGTVNPITGIFTPPAGLVAQDTSTAGNTPPALPNGDAPIATPVSLVAQKIDVVKSAASPKQTGPSKYDIAFTINVKNSGSVPATNVNVVDNLALTFATGTPTLSISVAPVVAAQGGASLTQCAQDSAFDGTGNIALLKGDQTLLPGESCVITFTVNVAYSSAALVPAAQQLNTAIATTASNPNLGGSYVGAGFITPTGILARDDSTNSPLLPATPNGDTPSPAPISFSPQVLDVIKSAGTPAQTGAATFEIPYTVIVKNTGSVIDTNVQAIDNLKPTFSIGTHNISIKTNSYAVNTTASAAVCAAPVVAYDGVSNVALLKGDFNLAAGEQCTINFVAVVTYASPANVPATAQNNTVFASTATGINAGGTVNPANGIFTPPAGEIAQDASTSGNIPPAAPNGDVPAPTPVTFTPQKIDTVKSAGTPIQNGPTIFDIPYSIKIKNTGTVPATNVNAVDNLALTFVAGAPTITVPSAPLITPSGGAAAAQCAVSASAFNGTTNLALLKGDQTLQPGQECDITFTVRVIYPNASAVPATAQNNTVVASTASSVNNGGSFTGSVFNAPSGQLAVDFSSNIATTPLTANGDTPSPTPITFSPQRLDAVKSAAPYIQTGPSSFEVPYSVIVKNTGTVMATNVQAVDSLRAAYNIGSPSLSVKAGSYSVTGAAACAAPITAFDGTTNLALLSGSGNLAAGEQCTITFTAVVAYPNTAAVPTSAQNNSVFATTATGANGGGSVNPATGAFTPPAGVVAQDASTSGNTPPAAANGDIPAPTPVTFATQKIDTVKSAAAPINLGSPAVTLPQVGFDVPYTIKVKNTGSVPATNVNVADNLANTFAAGSPAVSIAVPSAVTPQGGATAAQCALAATAFNGITSLALLKGDQTLQPGQECDLAFTVRVIYANAAAVPQVQQVNTAVASTATAPNNGGSFTGSAFNPPAGALARDASTDSSIVPGTPNGDTPLPTPVSFSAQRIDVVKGLTGQRQVSPTSFEADYVIKVKNSVVAPATNVQVVDKLTNTFSVGTPVLSIKNFATSANGGAVAAQCAGPAATFDGINNIALLKGDQSLNNGQECDIAFTVVVSYPNAAAVPTAVQNNVANATTSVGPNSGGGYIGTQFISASGVIAEDASTDSTTPPSPANNDLPGNTPVTLVPQKIDTIKSALTPLQLGAPAISGSQAGFDVLYTITIKNTGTVPATNVNAVDNLALTFVAGAPTITVPSAPLITPSGGAAAAQCAVSASAFNGTTNLALLKGDQTLQPGQECDITFTVRVIYPNASAVPATAQNNTVVASTASSVNNGGSFTGSVFNAPSGQLAVDFSSNIATTPLTANGDTPSPTPITFSPQRLDAVKSAAPYIQTGPSSFEVPYSVIVKNTGTVMATNVQAVDSLRAAYNIGSPSLSVKAGSYSVTGAAACAAPITAFDGTTNLALLSGSGNLAAGEQCTITFTAVVAYPNTAAVPTSAQNNSVFATTATGANGGGSVNPATGAFTPPAGVVAQDASTSGNTPPAAANGDIPAPTPVTFATQKIDTVKSAAAPINLGSPAVTLPQVGFDVPYTIKVKNTGSVPATNVNVADNLANTFAAGSPAVSIAVPSAVTPQGGATAAQCALAATAFNGITSLALLKGDQTLQPGQECDLAFTVRVIYANAAAVPQVQQVNTAVASTATAPNNGGSFTGSAFNPPAGALARDASTDSSIVPGTPNGDTPLPTPVSFSAQRIDVVKGLTGQRQVSPTSFEADYVIKVKNSVVAPATNVQVVDKLTNTFSVGTPVLSIKNFATSANGGAVAAQCAGPAATFDGINNIALLKGDQSLNNGQECDIAFTVVVSYPNAAAVPTAVQNNVANATTSVGPNSGGTFTGATFNPPAGTVAQDASTNGIAPPVTANSDVASPTPVSFAAQKIDVIKSAGPVAQISATSFESTFTIKVRNLSAEPATNVNAVDTLATWFAAGAPNILVSNFVITAAGTTPLAKCVGPSIPFDGKNAIALLAGTQTFTQNEGCDISFKVALTYPNSAAIPNGALNNSAVATTTPVGQTNTGGSYSGTTYTPAANTLAQDISTDGNTPPATANGDAPAPTPVNLVAAKIDVVKSAGVPKQTGPKTFQISYAVVIGNAGAASPTVYGVQANDSLAAAFPGATVNVSGYNIVVIAPTAAASCSGNAAFNGVADTRLMSGTTDFKGGEACLISFTTNVDYGTNAVPIAAALNSVYASGVPAGVATAGSPNPGYAITVAPGGAVPIVIPPASATTTDISVNGNAPPAGSAPGTLVIPPVLPITPGGDASAGVPTPALLAQAKLDVVKSAGVPKQVATKVFEIPYTIVVGNIGVSSPIIYNVKAQDNLTRTFPNATISIKAASYVLAPSTGATCTAPTIGYNGTTNNDLLAGTDDLAGDQSCTIKFIVVVDYGTNAVDNTPRNNTTYVSGMGDNSSVNPGYVVPNDPALIPTPPAGAVATDLSVTGAAPASGSAPGTAPADPVLPSTPNADTPAGLPTSVLLSTAKLDVVKSAGAPLNTAANRFEVPYAVVVGNSGTGGPTAYNVQANDSLAATFPNAASVTVKAGSYSVVPGAAAVCTPNTAFDGVVDTRLLAGADTLQGGQACTIIFTAEVVFAAGQIPIVAQNNTAFASATPAGSGANAGYAITQPAGGGAPGVTPPVTAVATDLSNTGPALPANAAPGTPAVIPSLPSVAGGDNPVGTPTPVVLKVNPGKITGSVWDDNGAGAATANNVKDPGEPGIAGWTVEVIDLVTRLPIIGTDGQPARAVTGADGSYSIANIPPGKWSLQFRAPGATAPGAVYGTPVNGELPNAGSTQSTANPATRSLDIDVTPGATIPQQSLPLDPSGVVYDSATRAPIGGATVTLLGPDGLPVPASLLLPNQQNQFTLATGPGAGAYRFDLLPAAPAGNYSIKITPPAGYTNLSTVLPPQSGSYAAPALPGAPVSLGTGKAPQAGEPTSYYLAFNLTPGTSRDVIHNNIPLDPTDSGALFIRKEVNRASVEMGDALTYRVTVRSTKLAGPAQVVDRLPLGFKLIPNTTKVGTAATSLIAAADPAGTPGPQLTFSVNLPINQDVVIEYKVRVGIGADRGDGINRAQAQLGALRSLEAQAKVKVAGGVFSRDACVIGKVFVDCNQNKQQDSGEPGIPGVRLYLEDGTNLTTDENGQYSLCGLRPITHVLKIDSTTMPIGSRMGISSSRNAGDADSLFIDLKAHELYRADFIEQSCFPKVLEQVDQRRKLGPVLVPQQHDQGKDEKWTIQFNSEQHKLDRTPSVNEGGRP
jgi:uncharacterized repeat protein (TIGR01451 family)